MTTLRKLAQMIQTPSSGGGQFRHAFRDLVYAALIRPGAGR